MDLTPQERDDLAQALAQERQVRRWRRYRAVELVADGQAVGEVARTLGCSVASVYNWLAAWKAGGCRRLQGTPPAGRTRLVDDDTEHTLRHLIMGDPQEHGYQATGWTVPLLTTESRRRGYQGSERTIRRALHRLGYRWKRPKYVLGRPDPAYTEKKSS